MNDKILKKQTLKPKQALSNVPSTKFRNLQILGPNLSKKL